MKKLLVICGPTATGKTALGIRLAKKFNGELISADSRQVYKGMDIGTGKDLLANSKLKTQSAKLQLKTKKYSIGYHLVNKIPIWLIDVIMPDYWFTVADYVKRANLVIKDIWGRDKLPILVGGTGFYIKALIDGIETIGIPPDWRMREQLDRWSVGQLGSYLKKLDPERWKKMNKSDRNNPRRLIRAIEISQSRHTSEVSPRRGRDSSTSKVEIERLLLIGLTASYRELYQRIDKRVDERVKQGIVGEIKSLLGQGYSWDNSVLGRTLGYKEFRPYFEGKTSLGEVVQRWKLDEHRYARQQMTWFKKALRQAQGIWFDITEKDFEKNLVNLVKTWYSKNDAQKN